MNRVVPICVALGVVAGLFLIFGEDEESRRSRKRKRQRKPMAPVIALTGTVQSGGEAVPKATVFLLDKKAYGGDRNRLPHVVTDANGRFRIRTRKIKDRWIGVVHERFMHAHQDLNALDASAPIAFDLKPARRVVVTVLDEDDKPVRNQLVQLTPWPPIDLYELPDPKHRQGEHTAITDARGRAEYWVGSDGPVTVRPELDGYFPEPHETHLAADEGVTVIRARKGVPFPLPVAIDSAFDVSLFCGAPDYALHSVHVAHARDGRVQGLWPPGTFGVLLQADGRTPCWLPTLQFSGSAGNTGPAFDAHAHGVTRFDPPMHEDAIVFARLSGGHPWARVNPVGQGGAWRFCQGQHQIHASRVRSGHVAIARVDVSQPAASKLDWKPGQWVRLKAIALPEEARRLIVEHETLGVLPLIGRTGTRARAGIELLHIHVGRPDAVVELGPYPAGTITVRGVR